MGLVAFDTHEFITGLQGAGLSAAQAEVLSDTYVRMMNEQVASKTDLLTLKTELIEKLAVLDTDLVTIKAKVDSLDEKFADLKIQFANFDTRLTALEAEVSDLRSEMRSGFELIAAQMKALEDSTLNSEKSVVALIVAQMKALEDRLIAKLWLHKIIFASLTIAILSLVIILNK